MTEQRLPPDPSSAEAFGGGDPADDPLAALDPVHRAGVQALLGLARHRAGYELCLLVGPEREWQVRLHDSGGTLAAEHVRHGEPGR